MSILDVVGRMNNTRERRYKPRWVRAVLETSRVAIMHQGHGDYLPPWHRAEKLWRRRSRS